MFPLTRKHLAALALALAALLPAPGRAQSIPVVLSAQERDMIALANDLSRKCAATMERWIASKEITQDRLFSFLYYPMPKIDPPKFTTDYDKLSDRDIQGFEEAALNKYPTISYAVMVDKNGYIPTSNLKYSQPLTGNRATDLLYNRTKIIHNHAVGLNAARSQAPFLFQAYKRDNGETLTEVSVPLYVNGIHWGAVRIGYRRTEG